MEDIITRQKAKIDDLERDDLPRCKDALRRANEIGMDLEKENQELRAEVEKLEGNLEQVEEAFIKVREMMVGYKVKLDTARAEAVKEFAERLKGKAFCYYNGCFCYEIRESDIDNLVKEMVGGVDNAALDGAGCRRSAADRTAADGGEGVGGTDAPAG